MSDPRFPDRPDHPDFWNISEAVIDLDAASDKGTAYDVVAGRIVDIPSALYVGRQRLRRMIDAKIKVAGPNLSDDEFYSMIMAGWMDGFFAGAEYHRIKSTKATPNFPPGRGKHHHG